MKLRVSTAIAVAVAFTVSVSAANSADTTTFRVGQSSPANTFLAIWMADDAGFYQANGLKLEIVPMAGGRDMTAAFADGRIDAMHIGLSSVVRANAANADLRAFGSLSNVIRFALFAKPGVKSADDLRGGTVAISSAGSESDATLPLMLGKLGLTRADVQIKELGLPRLAAVQSGAVAATAVNEPDRSRAYAAGLTALVDLAQQRVPWLFTGLVAKRSFIADHRETLLRFLKATIEGNHLAISDEQRAKASGLEKAVRHRRSKHHRYQLCRFQRTNAAECRDRHRRRPRRDRADRQARCEPRSQRLSRRQLARHAQDAGRFQVAIQPHAHRLYGLSSGLTNQSRRRLLGCRLSAPNSEIAQSPARSEKCWL